MKTAGPDIVTAGEIVKAPTRLARPLVSALDAAEAIRGSVAVREGWLTGVDVDAAEAAVLSCTDRVKAGTQRLVDIADRVGSFDRELSEPARRAELTKERERRTRRTREQVAKLSAARTAVENIVPAPRQCRRCSRRAT